MSGIDRDRMTQLVWHALLREGFNCTKTAWDDEGNAGTLTFTREYAAEAIAHRILEMLDDEPPPARIEADPDWLDVITGSGGRIEARPARWWRR